METRLEARMNALAANIKPVTTADRETLQRQDFVAAAFRLPDGDP